MNRRKFLQSSMLAACAAGSAGLAFNLRGQKAHAWDMAEAESVIQKTPVIGSKKVNGKESAGSAARVYYSPIISEDALIKLYNLVNEGIYGKVALKVHTGERNGPNILPREMVRALQRTIPQSAIVETNTAYIGDRDTTEKHRKTLEINGWTFCPVDIMDEHGDASLPVKSGFHLKEVAVGKGLLDYDALVALTHFKGHPTGGFGGSMKNIAIGCASGKTGKRQVHQVKGDPPDWSKKAEGDLFMERMADSAKAVLDHFGKRAAFINVLRNMSADCDCVGVKAAKPETPDMGILASTDLLAIDQAACDLVFGLAPAENHALTERILSRHGLRQLSAMAELKMGNPRYELILVE